MTMWDEESAKQVAVMCREIGIAAGKIGDLAGQKLAKEGRDKVKAAVGNIWSVMYSEILTDIIIRFPEVHRNVLLQGELPEDDISLKK